MMPPSITIVSRGAWRCWASAAASSGTPTPAKTVVSSVSWREPITASSSEGVTAVAISVHELAGTSSRAASWRA